MKIIYSIFILLICTADKIFSQNNAKNILHLTKFPPEGILLDKGWKFQTGDNPEWAKPEYDDSKWQPINPTLDIHDSLPQIPRSGIVWLRLHLLVDTAVNNPLALIIWQSGASEMYLNGKLFHSFGVLSTDMDKVKAYNPYDKPVSFPVTQTGAQTLAIRYALQSHITYTAHWFGPSKGLSIAVNTLEKADKQFAKYNDHNRDMGYVRVGTFGILAILYLTFYLFNPAQKVNLYFSVYYFLVAAFWSIFEYLMDLHFIGHSFLINNFLVLIQVVGALFLLEAIYEVLQQKQGWFYYSLFALGALCIPAAIFIYGWGWLVFAILFSNLINFEITRVAFVAIRKHKKGAWILAAGGISFFVFWILFTVHQAGFWADSPIVFFDLAQVSVPVTVSIYLGYDFALTNRSLQQKLTEVENLSSEKQQILFAQNETLEKKVTQRTAELQNSLKELKSTQSQLIQSEKMASLGELTAGIAHEIQNPLNFVNNFSDVNIELLEELKEEADKGNIDEVKAIANDVIDNEEKINHHGKRADTIVKGMLQHSRTNTGKKEPTDINSLCDEYLRLSYHGLRAKDKDFNADFKTDFDESIGKINIVPQDIGRVLLNLFNNAFYAVKPPNPLKGEHYKPLVTVTTRKASSPSGAGGIEIIVSDNGNGIPQTIVDKIFQPFFTTKPTGEGTGLGLSLSYDIIKAHGGEIKVETKEGKGTTFVIDLLRG